MNNPHCGACRLEFPTGEELMTHLESCAAVRAMKFPITMVMLGARDAGHEVSHLAFSAGRYADLIREYASAIATEMNSFQRSQIHKRLCDRLGLEYSEFRPFESEAILEVPTQDEAERIIWEALGKILREGLIKNGMAG